MINDLDLILQEKAKLESQSVYRLRSARMHPMLYQKLLMETYNPLIRVFEPSIAKEGISTIFGMEIKFDPELKEDEFRLEWTK